MRFKIMIGFEILLILMFICITFYKHIQIVRKYDRDKWIQLLKHKHKILEFIKKYIGCFIIIILSLIVFFIILKSSYGVNSDLLAAYCSFLTFVGTFMIGYYIYRKEKDDENRAKRNKCNRLARTIMTAYVSLNNLDDNKSQKYEIVYDKNWYVYMMEYIELTDILRYGDMYTALSSFFYCIDCINIELRNNNFEKAIMLRNEYEEQQRYLPIKYNIMDIVFDISDFELRNKIGVFDETVSKWYIHDPYRRIYAVQPLHEEELKKYIKEYYNVVELLIYNDVIKNGSVSVYTTNKNIIEKLFSDSPLPRRMLEEMEYYNLHMVTHIVWGISEMIKDKSKIIQINKKYYNLKK